MLNTHFTRVSFLIILCHQCMIQLPILHVVQEDCASSNLFHQKQKKNYLLLFMKKAFWCYGLIEDIKLGEKINEGSFSIKKTYDHKIIVVILFDSVYQFFVFYLSLIFSFVQCL